MEHVIGEDDQLGLPLFEPFGVAHRAVAGNDEVGIERFRGDVSHRGPGAEHGDSGCSGEFGKHLGIGVTRSSVQRFHDG